MINRIVHCGAPMVACVLALVASTACAGANKGENWPMERFVLDNVVSTQLPCGGWAKNIDKTKPGMKDRKAADAADADATIDNNATISEIRFLLKWHSVNHDGESLDAARRGLRWLLSVQLDNGGWAQFPGRAKGYWTQITFNDNAMCNVLALLKDAAEGKDYFRELDDLLRSQCAEAFDRGIDCVLKCQIRVDGVPTVWCQQHDRNTLEPASGRAYELKSFCSQESAEIMVLLMEIENPSLEIVNAIEGAAAWFERTRLENGQWARFYDLEECRPFFCDRSGIPRRDLSEIDPERRKGYKWFNSKGDKALKKFTAWRKKLKKQSVR